MPFGSRKKKEATPQKAEVQERVRRPTELEELCEDKGIHKALFNIMLLNPRYVEISMEDAAKKGQKAERRKETEAARKWYEMAGGIAIYEGKVQKVIEYFGKVQEMSSTEYPMVDNAEQAVAMAREYYKKCLK